MPPVELHLRHRAYDVAASHQAVAWEHQEHRQCGVSLTPLRAEHYYALSVEEYERQETAECLRLGLHSLRKGVCQVLVPIS